MKIYTEWFWSQASAAAARDRLVRKHGADGFTARIRYAMAADGRHDWLLEVFA
jgi:hypothetical protein